MSLTDPVTTVWIKNSLNPYNLIVKLVFHYNFRNYIKFQLDWYAVFSVFDRHRLNSFIYSPHLTITTRNRCIYSAYVENTRGKIILILGPVLGYHITESPLPQWGTHWVFFFLFILISCAILFISFRFFSLLLFHDVLGFFICSWCLGTAIAVCSVYTIPKNLECFCLIEIAIVIYYSRGT